MDQRGVEPLSEKRFIVLLRAQPFFKGFPPAAKVRRNAAIGSFMIRPYAQSFAYVVSCMDEAGYLTCRCIKADPPHSGSDSYVIIVSV